MQASGRDALSINVEKSTSKSLKFLDSFGFLRCLDVIGAARNLEAIAALTGLRELCLLGVTVPRFEFLDGLNELRLFDMRFGGNKAFDTLASAKSLIGVRLLRLPSLRNLDFVRSLTDLQLLDVDSCKGIVALPDFSNNTRLRKLVLQTMNGLATLKRLETASQLQQLVVYGAKALPPAEFAHATRRPGMRKVYFNRILMTGAEFQQAVAQIPSEIYQEHYFGTEFDRFDFDGYDRPVESDAANRRGGS